MYLYLVKTNFIFTKIIDYFGKKPLTHNSTNCYFFSIVNKYLYCFRIAKQLLRQKLLYNNNKNITMGSLDCKSPCQIIAVLNSFGMTLHIRFFPPCVMHFK